MKTRPPTRQRPLVGSRIRRRRGERGLCLDAKAIEGVPDLRTGPVSLEDVPQLGAHSGRIVRDLAGALDPAIREVAPKVRL